MPTLPPEAVGDAYTDSTAWNLLADLADLGDRMPGHEGEAAGASLVADALADAGLDEVSVTEFPIPGWWRGDASLTVERGGRTATFGGSHELVELPGTPSGEATGEVVDMGYGLPEDFEDVDLTGRIAMASSLTPDDYGRWVHRSEKYDYAAESGAEGFLFYNHIEGSLPPTGDVGHTNGPGPIPAVGEPTEVYENPVNEFVAGFIGSPSMNFIDVEVETDGTTATIRDDDSGLALSLSRDYVAGHALECGRYTLGVRPENIDVAEEPTGDETLAATVEVVEPIGSDNYVHLSVNDDFLARSPADVKPEAGDEVGVSFDEEHVHLFDTETGEDVFLTEEEVEAAVA